MKKKYTYVKLSLLLVAFFGVTLTTVGQSLSIYATCEEFISTPDPPNDGYIHGANWTKEGPIKLKDASDWGTSVYFSEYTEEGATVTCNYTYTYYSGLREYAGHGSRTYFITCKPVYTKLSKTSLYIQKGESVELSFTYSAEKWAKNKTKWTSSDETIVKVGRSYNTEKGGYASITAVGTGNAYINIHTGLGPDETCMVIVGDSPDSNPDTNPDQSPNPTTDKTIVIKQKSGQETIIQLYTNPVITFDNGNMVVKSDRTTVTLPLSDVDNYIMTEGKTVGIYQPTLFPQLSEGSISFNGLAPGAIVRIHSIEGKFVTQYSVDDHSRCVISLQSLPKGIYIISTGGNSIKVVNK